MASLALSDVRNRLLGSARFRDFVQKIPLIQYIARSQANDLFRLCGGFIHSQVLLACVRLGLIERLRAGPVPAERLRREAGLSEAGAEHLFAAAEALALLEYRDGDAVGLGRRGATLLDNPGVLAMIRHHAMLYEDLADPVALFRGDRSNTRMANLWAYATPDDTREMDRGSVSAYSELMAVSQAMVAEQVLGAVPFRRQTSLLDIGGGSGAFAMAAASRWPRLDVTVVDLPPVADIARDRIHGAGLQSRIDVFGADASRDPLPDGFDVVSLVRVLHDHDDEMVRLLLAAALRAVRPGGTLLIAEPMAGEGAAGRLVSVYFNVYLLAMGSGRPRSPVELAQFLRAAGFRRVRRRRTGVPMITQVILATAPDTPKCK
jgi:demethylspheroidene O-methyltransferase